MSNSYQSEIPKARVNIQLSLHTGGAQKKVELPLKLVLVGDYSNGTEQRPVSEREKVNVNKNNFDSVLAEFSPAIKLSVENTLAHDGSEEAINLTFRDMKDFTPEQVARQIPQLKAMLAMRNLLRDLKANLLDNQAFRKELEKILVSHRWGTLWPQPVHARMEILSSLSQRLQQRMRSLPLNYCDLSQLYRAEKLLKSLGEVLQRLELKHLSQFDTLRTLMHNSAARLENSNEITTLHSGSGLSAKVMKGAAASTEAHIDSPLEENIASDSTVKWVYVAQPEPQAKVEGLAAMPTSVKKWKSFAAGMVTMLVSSIVTVWAWQYLSRPDPLQIQLAASLAPIPAMLSPAQLDVLRQQSPLPQTVIAQTQQQIARLDKLPPDWNIARSRQLVDQAQVLWPEQAKLLAQQWRQQLNAAALPTDHLDGWHLGMTKLQQLSDRLNGLDEQKGKYMTVSELKSVVFSAMQSFNQSMPAEEWLRVLSQTPAGQPLPSAEKAQAEMHLKQLIARYALVAQSDDAQRSLIQLKTTDE